MAYLRKRKRELEGWLLEWYSEIDKPEVIAFYDLELKGKEDIEYIRKDALLKWAKKERAVGSDCKSCDGWAYAFSTMIEKLYSM